LKKYLLFIDIETTGIPKRWNLPYAETDNWPSTVQVAWILTDENSIEVKRENFFIDIEDLKISSQSLAVHGITKEFLSINGRDRICVLTKLRKDILQYQPLVIGHFTEFDIHTLSCDYYRADLENPFYQSRFYCTMLKSEEYVMNPLMKYLRLPQLYHFLFDSKMENSHDALIDAEITSKCFFEMYRRGEIAEESFEQIYQKIICKLKF